MRVLLPLSGIDLLRYYFTAPWPFILDSQINVALIRRILRFQYDPSFRLPTGVVLGTCFQ